jgi:hypothetical protein
MERAAEREMMAGEGNLEQGIPLVRLLDDLNQLKEEDSNQRRSIKPRDSNSNDRGAITSMDGSSSKNENKNIVREIFDQINPHENGEILAKALSYAHEEKNQTRSQNECVC